MKTEKKLFKTTLSENDNFVDSIEIEALMIPDDHVVTGIEATIDWSLNLDVKDDELKITADVSKVKIEITTGLMRSWGDNPSYDKEETTEMSFVSSEIRVQFMGDFDKCILIQPDLIRVSDNGCMVFF